MRTFTIAALLALGVSLPLPAVSASYSYLALDSLGGTSSLAYGINASGQVVGKSFLAGDMGNHAVLWKAGVPIDLGPGAGGGQNSDAYAINNAGQVAGNSESPGVFPPYATVWNGSTPTSLGTGSANAINDRGQIVGASGSRPTLWSDGHAIDLGTLGGASGESNGINELGAIVGYSTDASNEMRATLWLGSAITDLGTLGGSSSSAFAINNAGQIVGSAMLAGNSFLHAALWSGFDIVDLGTLGGNASRALAINSSGSSVGWSTLAGSDYFGAHATLWENGGIIDLNSFLSDDATRNGWYLHDAVGINDQGVIAGNAYNSLTSQTQAFVLIPVPEPGRLMLMLSGVALTGWMGWRGSKRKAMEAAQRA